MNATVGGLLVNRSPEWQAMWDAVEEQMAREGLTLEDLPLYDEVGGSYSRVELAFDKLIQSMVDNGEPETPEQAIEVMLSDRFADMYYWPNEQSFEEALFDHPDIP